jgi:ferritin-like metal-binding protein YciE
MVKALPQLRDAAVFADLRHALLKHFEETEIQVDRFDEVFGWFGEKSKSQRARPLKVFSTTANM